MTLGNNLFQWYLATRSVLLILPPVINLLRETLKVVLVDPDEKGGHRRSFIFGIFKDNLFSV
jgi:hypothetical protein